MSTAHLRFDAYRTLAALRITRRSYLSVVAVRASSSLRICCVSFLVVNFACVLAERANSNFADLCRDAQIRTSRLGASRPRRSGRHTLPRLPAKPHASRRRIYPSSEVRSPLAFDPIRSAQADAHLSTPRKATSGHYLLQLRTIWVAVPPSHRKPGLQFGSLFGRYRNQAAQPRSVCKKEAATRGP